MSKRIEELYIPSSASLYNTFMIENGVVGFSIPEYQRRYDWSKDNILRLFQNCLNGFSALSQNSDEIEYTFLGTLILLDEKNLDTDFRGKSLTVVDGQQRLTSLALIACALIDKLKRERKTISVESEEIEEWISQQLEVTIIGLSKCICGKQDVEPTATFPFPRIVRNFDTRGSKSENSVYISPVSTFLFTFYNNYFTNNLCTIPMFESDTDSKKLRENFNQIKGLLTSVDNDRIEDEDNDWIEDEDYEIVKICKMTLTNLSKLFHEPDSYLRINDIICKNVSESIKFHNFIRTLLFSRYFLSNIALTFVKTESESAAFDIFDALNTTGQPLTGLETLKPVVHSHLKLMAGIEKNKIEKNLSKIDKYVDNKFENTNKKNTVTKEMIVNFALYYEGEKISQKLSTQRVYLRNKFEKQVNRSDESIRHFVEDLANLAQFKYYYWYYENIGEINKFHSDKFVDEIMLLMSIIKGINTKLAMPILFCYWRKCKGEKFVEQDDQNFLEVLKALSAFIIIRRSATGTTSGIDTDLRSVMSETGFRLSVKYSEELPSIESIRNYLHDILANGQLELNSKENWCEQVSKIAIYRGSRNLAKALLLIAAHGAIPSESNPGCWDNERKDLASSNYLTYNMWKSENTRTIEHIAPSANQSEGWSKEIYSDSTTRHTIGNLCLLSDLLNKVISDRDWESKKMIYNLLVEKGGDELENGFKEVEAMGINLSEELKTQIRKNKLSLLTPLKYVDDWNNEIISNRSFNVASRVWDYVSPWVGY